MPIELFGLKTTPGHAHPEHPVYTVVRRPGRVFRAFAGQGGRPVQDVGPTIDPDEWIKHWVAVDLTSPFGKVLPA